MIFMGNNAEMVRNRIMEEIGIDIGKPDYESSSVIHWGFGSYSVFAEKENSGFDFSFRDHVYGKGFSGHV
jgi:hypothetical protein